ncbi:MAG: glycosyltransferase [Desulfarculus sp.]|nr:glycosyltransferase [Pseudomonadota bacterium]MBV1716580.1 glycosyltransferase [Desulfarculus sp.]MBU4575965.1 glycosyltransferase [Pseudomonadota bacterium]MBU4597708.1 glycosyltransferase [Pseudomonadota bacterium]MBV1736766.1 glycosyltransferase [Desulfarculus sp.]
MQGGVCLLITLQPIEQDVPGGIRTRKHFSLLAKLGWEPYAICRDHTQDKKFGLRVLTPEDFLRFADEMDRSLEPPREVPASRAMSPADWSWGAGRLRNRLKGARPKRYLPFTDGWSLGIPLDEVHAQAARIAPDIIVSSSPPVYGHVVAGKVAARLNRPWVAELRDLWADNWSNRKAGFLYRLELQKEKKTLGQAKALITVTEYMANLLREKHDLPSEVVFPSFWSSSTGGDQKQDAWPRLEPLPLRLVFTGRFYHPGNMPHALLEAMADLLASGEILPNEILLDLYSPNPAQLKSYVTQSFGGRGEDILKVCRAYQPVAHELVKPLLESHHLLLALGVDGPGNEGVITSKLPEYLGSSAPILATGNPDSYMIKVVEETGTGFVATTAEQCKDVLRRAVVLARKGEAIARPNPKPEAIAEFTSPRQAERLSRLLERVLGSRATRVA